MKRKYKILIGIVAAIVLIFSLFYFGNMGLKPQYEWHSHPLALEMPRYKDDNERNFHYETVRQSTGAVTAEFITYYLENDLHVWVFNKKDTVYGNIPEETIKVTRTFIDENRINHINGESFVSGEEYLLILYRDASDKENVRYDLLGQVCIPLSDINAATWDRGDIYFGYGISSKDVINYFKEMAMEKGFNLRSYRP